MPSATFKSYSDRISTRRKKSLRNCLRGIYFSSQPLCTGRNMGQSNLSEDIKAIIIGTKDRSGNEITQVLAKGNEYAIYEVNHKDINFKLRVHIDGYNEASEKILIEKLT